MSKWMRCTWVVSLLVIGAFASGCGDGSGSGPDLGEIPSMTGRWQGSRSELGWIVTVDLRLAEEESGRFTGSGHIDIVPKGGADGTVTGLHTHPDVSLAAEAPGFLWANFDGTFEGEDLIVGSVHSPFVGTIAFALHRL